MGTKQVMVEIPEKVLLASKMDADAFAGEMQILTAVKLYELGRLSSGRAAELAGIPRVEFLLKLGEYQVFPLMAELDDLECRFRKLSALVHFPTMFHQMNNDHRPFVLAECIQYSMVSDPQLVQPLEASSQQFPCHHFKILSQPADFLEYSLSNTLT